MTSRPPCFLCNHVDLKRSAYKKLHGVAPLSEQDFKSSSFGWRRCKPGLFLIGILFMFTPPTLNFGQEFVSRTQSAGLGSVGRTNGVALADYDRDGDLDVYFVVQDFYDRFDSKTWNRLFSNNGDGTFLDVTSVAGLAGKNSNTAFSYMGYKMGAAWGDYDNDGWPDIFLTHFGPDQLFHNNRDGTFSEVTAQAGVAGAQGQLSSSALWFDYDLDGDLDLYVSNWEDYGENSNDLRNWLYENRGDDSFLDVSEASGLADPGQTWTTVAIDANNDGHLDLYLANDFGPNKFYLNNGDKTFQEKTAGFGLEDPFQGMGLAVTDCDGNGFFDIYLTNVSTGNSNGEINPLFLNTGQSFFIDYSVEAGVSQAGWGWGTEFFDLENDGDDDLFVATGYFSQVFPNVLFRHNPDSGTVNFENVSSDFGLDDRAEARGLAVFDYDNDGDCDLLISNFAQAPSLYENPMAHGNWLDVKLEGTTSNRDAFGAVVEVWAQGESQRKYHHGAQFLAQNIQPLHFGLGGAQEIERITVTWPGGQTEDVGTAEVNQKIHVKESHGIINGVRQAPANATRTPEALRLVGNYPNPFNGTTRIRFEVLVPGEVEVKINNLQGQTVKVINSSFPTIGEKTIGWDATDWRALPVSSGIYLYTLKIKNEMARPGFGKMLYIK